MKTTFLTFLFASSLLIVSGQSSESDSIPEHPYRKSIMFSAIIPGGGQVHNSIVKKKGFRHAICKVPLIYGALGASTFMLIQNHQTQKSLKNDQKSSKK